MRALRDVAGRWQGLGNGQLRPVQLEGLKSETLYGPTKRAEMVGPIDECPLDEVALNPEMAAKLWTLSEQKTSLNRSLSLGRDYVSG